MPSALVAVAATPGIAAGASQGGPTLLLRSRLIPQAPPPHDGSSALREETRNDSTAQALAAGGERPAAALVRAAASASADLAVAGRRGARTLCTRSGQFRAAVRGSGR